MPTPATLASTRNPASARRELRARSRFRRVSASCRRRSNSSRWSRPEAHDIRLSAAMAPELPMTRPTLRANSVRMTNFCGQTAVQLRSTWRKDDAFRGPGAAFGLVGGGSRAAPSQRQVVVLARRHLDFLPPEHRQGACDPLAGGARHDHLVDIAALGGHERRQEAILVFLGARRDLLGVADVGPEDDLYRPLGAHHGDL